MGQTVCYQLYTSSTTSGAVVGTLTVLRDGILRGLTGNVNGTAGAGTGYALLAATHNAGGVVFANQNDPVRQPILASLGWSNSSNSMNYNYSTGFVPVNRRVKAGDTLNCEQTLGGTAAAAMIQRWNFFVEEA